MGVSRRHLHRTQSSRPTATPPQGGAGDVGAWLSPRPPELGLPQGRGERIDSGSGTDSWARRGLTPRNWSPRGGRGGIAGYLGSRLPGVTAGGPPPSGTGQRLGAPGSAPSSGDASDAPAAGRGETGAAVGRGVSGPRSDANPTAVLCSGDAPPSGRRRCRAVGRGSGPRGRRSFSLLGREDAALPAPRSSGLPSVSTAARTRGSRGCEHPGGTSGLPSPRPNRAVPLGGSRCLAWKEQNGPRPPQPPFQQRNGRAALKRWTSFHFIFKNNPAPKKTKRKPTPPPTPQKKKNSPIK